MKRRGMSHINYGDVRGDVPLDKCTSIPQHGSVFSKFPKFAKFSGACHAKARKHPNIVKNWSFEAVYLTFFDDNMKTFVLQLSIIFVTRSRTFGPLTKRSPLAIHKDCYSLVPLFII